MSRKGRGLLTDFEIKYFWIFLRKDIKMKEDLFADFMFRLPKLTLHPQ